MRPVLPSRMASWFGGWCWKKLTPLLRAQGHEVFTPTLTGLGERAHLARPEIGLEIHVRDIINVIEYEDVGLPPNASVLVQLLDVPLANAPTRVIAEDRIRGDALRHWFYMGLFVGFLAFQTSDLLQNEVKAGFLLGFGLSGICGLLILVRIESNSSI
jgi:hypothetical protein